MDTKGYERLSTNVYHDAGKGSREVAQYIAKVIRKNNSQNENTVLGLATGTTPVRVYDELIRLHQEGLTFANVITFNLDEYYPIEPSTMQSYVRFMEKNLFRDIDIPKENIHIPDGTVDREEVAAYCRSYENKIKKCGGIELQLLGIGRNGHIGFNEPGSDQQAMTRLVTLDKKTREDAAADFLGEENVPRYAISMGVGSILDADEIILMAWGKHKAQVIARTIEGEVSNKVPATFLQNHDNTAVILDEAASTELTRKKTPWLVKVCKWDDRLIKKAIVWLSKQCSKPVLKLTDKDYNENGLSELLTKNGPAYNINLKVFKQIQNTISGWPGGKPSVDDTNRPERSEPFPKRVLVLSPHPDDDIVSMGGTLMRLVNQGHDLNIAYQTSGSNGVYDEEAIRFADFVIDYHEAFGLETEEVSQVFRNLRTCLAEKSQLDTDTKQLREIKTLIRAAEAKAVCRYVGIEKEQRHFLNMPFYETGEIRKKPLSPKDVQLLVALLRKKKPHQIYASGDLTDPHGTHRICLQALDRALDDVKEDAWFEDCCIWLYNGVWQKWGTHSIDMAVPLSPDELSRKRNAILKHESQKDRPLYPGNDSREFWERIEERNIATAQNYDALGLAEYEAIEGFVRWENFSI